MHNVSIYGERTHHSEVRTSDSTECITCTSKECEGCAVKYVVRCETCGNILYYGDSVHDAVKVAFE